MHPILRRDKLIEQTNKQAIEMRNEPKMSAQSLRIFRKKIEREIREAILSFCFLSFSRNFVRSDSLIFLVCLSVWVGEWGCLCVCVGVDVDVNQWLPPPSDSLCLPAHPSSCASCCVVCPSRRPSRNTILTKKGYSTTNRY